MLLADYIDKHYDGNKAAFARAFGVHHPQQVSPWIRAGWIVFDGKLYSPRRELKRAT